MKLFLDSANLDEIEKAASTGLIDGITTNPSLVAQGKTPFEELLKRVSELVNGPISAEVLSTEHQAMLEEGRKLAKIHPNIVVKVPLTIEGLKATQIFSKEDIKTNVTLCFSPVQAMLAAKAGATYVSPFVGRLDDISESGMGLIQEILEVYSNYAYQTEVLVASVRHVEHVRTAALMGADVSTIPYGVFQKLIHHPLTDQGLERFLKDWESWKSSKA